MYVSRDLSFYAIICNTCKYSSEVPCHIGYYQSTANDIEPCCIERRYFSLHLKYNNPYALLELETNLYLSMINR